MSTFPSASIKPASSLAYPKGCTFKCSQLQVLASSTSCKPMWWRLRLAHPSVVSSRCLHVRVIAHPSDCHPHELSLLTRTGLSNCLRILFSRPSAGTCRLAGPSARLNMQRLSHPTFYNTYYKLLTTRRGAQYMKYRMGTSAEASKLECSFFFFCCLPAGMSLKLRLRT